MFLCVDCLKENVACTQNGQCCPSSECVYGRCKSGAKQGDAGKFDLCLPVHFFKDFNAWHANDMKGGDKWECEKGKGEGGGTKGVGQREMGKME